MDTQPVLRLEGIRRSFPDGAGGRTAAVDGVDLTVSPGEVVALLGPNGAGKTTLIDIVLGLVAAEDGFVEVLGTTSRRAVTSGRISALLQTGGLLPDLSVRETVKMIASLHRNPRDTDEVLAAAGAAGFASRRVSRCSGGEQQRLRFALALLTRPEVLILDEPTTGMDVNARHDFWRNMSSLADEGATIVFATHYLEEAERFARRTVLMDAGRVLADGPTADIRRRAGAARVTVTWAPSDAELAALDHVLGVERHGARIELRTDDADALARELLTRTGAHGIEVASASLDEAFRYLTAPSDEKEVAA
ncbi:ABC transporter ATP-binding protein [Zhihengliuella salsuginis]|uniref:ABC transporter ATP-binding protein n=1 Tax=Zhihengliuella salsuginis TaxID=578222 RepID=A0ABQ3GEZ8_9MICC|nr:ABC transporter ATP-binding protein [Zhihengliuella salsuginis]GHD04047.1 ABC transporter ATP-binding protein [Zhihengliuella salsuginis]